MFNQVQYLYKIKPGFAINSSALLLAQKILKDESIYKRSEEILENTKYD